MLFLGIFLGTPLAAQPSSTTTQALSDTRGVKCAVVASSSREDPNDAGDSLDGPFLPSTVSPARFEAQTSLPWARTFAATGTGAAVHYQARAPPAD